MALSYNNKLKIYNYPAYYSIAFDFVDIAQQIKIFTRFIKKFSKIKVKRVLDLGAGPGKQSLAFARKGYEVIALDQSTRMIEYLKKRADEGKARLAIHKNNFISFSLPKKVDFAFMLMGTISHIKSNAEFLKHLDSVAKSLRSGGLYLIENVILTGNASDLFKTQRWSMAKKGVVVETSFLLRPVDVLKQLVEENITFKIKEKNHSQIIKSSTISKIIFPQEFVELVRMNGNFEFVGWFENQSTKRLTRAKNKNFVLLRKK